MLVAISSLACSSLLVAISWKEKKGGLARGPLIKEGEPRAGCLGILGNF